MDQLMSVTVIWTNQSERDVKHSNTSSWEKATATVCVKKSLLNTVSVEYRYKNRHAN